MAATLTGYLMAAQENPAELYKVGLGSVRFLMSVGDLLIGWLLLRQSEVAIEALDDGAADEDKRVLRGQGRRGVVLREERPAAADQHPPDRREPRQRHHGTRRSRVLSLLPLRTKRPPDSSRGSFALRRWLRF